MSINYKNVFLALLAAILIAVPTAAVLQGKNAEIQKGEQQHLLEIKKRDSQIQDSNDQLKQKTDENDRLKKQNDQLKKDLQAKAERKAEEARIAAANAQKQKAAVSVAGVSGNCESYRPLVQKYFGSATPAAMIVMSKESGCDPNAISATNDHGLFQLNAMPIYEPEANIRAAYAKYVSPRRGTNPNFSAWYAVCTPDLVPKYAGIWCA